MRLVLLALALMTLLALPRWLFSWHFGRQVHALGEGPSQPRPVAIIFGAGLRWDGMPTGVLADRVATGVALYRQGLVSSLLMSGTRRSDGYDEPASMTRLAVEMGVPADAIRQDSGGTRTIQTCRRAAEVFGIQSAVLVSQRYHLPRALATCRAMGISAEAVAADLREYRAAPFWHLREYPATLVAVWEAYLRPVRPRPSASLPALQDPHGPN